MTTLITTTGAVPDAAATRFITAADSAVSGAFSQGWQQFANTQIAAAIGGTATSVTAVVERSATNPNSSIGAVACPADAVGLSGNAATGIPVSLYTEPGVGWWRIRTTAVSGGTVTLALSGGSGIG